MWFSENQDKHNITISGREVLGREVPGSSRDFWEVLGREVPGSSGKRKGRRGTFQKEEAGEGRPRQGKEKRKGNCVSQKN